MQKVICILFLLMYLPSVTLSFCGAGKLTCKNEKAAGAIVSKAGSTWNAKTGLMHSLPQRQVPASAKNMLHANFPAPGLPVAVPALVWYVTGRNESNIFPDQPFYSSNFSAIWQPPKIC